MPLGVINKRLGVFPFAPSVHRRFERYGLNCRSAEVTKPLMQMSVANIQHYEKEPSCTGQSKVDGTPQNLPQKTPFGGNQLNIIDKKISWLIEVYAVLAF
jgi:hypothetical protein